MLLSKMNVGNLSIFGGTPALLNFSVWRYGVISSIWNRMNDVECFFYFKDFTLWSL